MFEVKISIETSLEKMVINSFRKFIDKKGLSEEFKKDLGEDLYKDLIPKTKDGEVIIK